MVGHQTCPWWLPIQTQAADVTAVKAGAYHSVVCVRDIPICTYTITSTRGHSYSKPTRLTLAD